MPTSASTGPVPQAAEATQAANPTTRVFARPSASRVVSSGIFLVLLTTMGMTWVSLSVPGCYSDLTAREPIGVEIVGGTEVAATGHITSDCSFSFGAMCDEVQRIEGSFSIDGTAPVAALLAIVIAGTVAAVGVMCSQNNWFSDGGCEGYNLFVEVDVTAAVTVPGGEPVVLRYARATVVLEGEITDGPAAGVRAVRSDGAIAWSNSVAPDGRFRLGLTPGTWLLFARSFSPNVVDGPSIAVIVSADGSYPAITITAPPR